MSGESPIHPDMAHTDREAVRALRDANARKADLLRRVLPQLEDQALTSAIHVELRNA